jgi:hypothetical protein
MSGKQAKRLRREQRLAGIEPQLDAKRRHSVEAAATLEKQRAEQDALRRDHPKEYDRQQRESREACQRAMRALGAVLAVIS